jgi:hypothetical protein
MLRCSGSGSWWADYALGQAPVLILPGLFRTDRTAARHQHELIVGRELHDLAPHGLCACLVRELRCSGIKLALPQRCSSRSFPGAPGRRSTMPAPASALSRSARLIVDVLPVVRGGIGRIDAERLDRIDGVQHLLDLGPSWKSAANFHRPGAHTAR